MKDLIAQIKNGTFSFDSLVNTFKAESDAFKANADIAPIWDKISGWLEIIAPYMAYILLAVGLIVALFGKKLLPIAKFLGFFLMGFGAGVLYLSPIITFIPSWVTGLVIGLIAAIFCKIFYYLVIAGAAGGAVYYICNTAMFLPQLTNYTKGNVLYCAIAAVVAVFLVFLLLKWIEMLGTAFLGGMLVVNTLNTLTNFMELDFIQNFNNIVYWVLIGIVALVGFAVQVKTRKRY